MVRIWLTAAVLMMLGAAALPGEAMAVTRINRAAIRATPILERPNRVGHFYGNAVRRNAGVSNGRAR